MPCELKPPRWRQSRRISWASLWWHSHLLLPHELSSLILACVHVGPCSNVGLVAPLHSGQLVAILSGHDSLSIFCRIFFALAFPAALTDRLCLKACSYMASLPLGRARYYLRLEGRHTGFLFMGEGASARPILGCLSQSCTSCDANHRESRCSGGSPHPPWRRCLLVHLIRVLDDGGRE